LSTLLVLNTTLLRLLQYSRTKYAGILRIIYRLCMQISKARMHQI